ncbi:uncharacterized protein CG1552 isoform X2 [Eupeodes corollae]|uniref:uncharacterized protein CG1552 isoform X2 n=1 Tax=Eupeodes corollae TaxID=290404 RepID=UPI00248F7AA0|nr:uncharacterized protein CG1552 isoform X2 [Eupeodes corollae]
MSMNWTIVLLLASATTTCAFLSLGYSSSSSLPADDMNNNILRTYRRCMWEQSKFLPRRLVLLSLCSNLFCENSQLVPRLSCLDMLPDQCIQGDEDDLMYKPFPDCCPVYCNLKRRLNRLKSMLFRHRVLNTPSQSVVLNELT